jgi:hypothetical protein
MRKFTFRKEKPETGLSAVGNPRPSTTIKLGGKWCGTIQAPNWHSKDGKWGVGLMVKDEDCTAGWRWVFFQKRFDAEPDAREWLNANAEAIANKYQIRVGDD